MQFFRLYVREGEFLEAFTRVRRGLRIAFDVNTKAKMQKGDGGGTIRARYLCVFRAFSDTLKTYCRPERGS